MPSLFRMRAQLSARTPLQVASLIAVLFIDLVGIVATATGHRDLGRSLIGLGIVLIGPFIFWMRKTNLTE